ncbi:DHA2 family efflux MFS transporter permease subunit [Kineosporia mesophila]|uniref:DHA2 family efflux MFS transporter permease subunit n=1 Tax=Kineosporia mesophila TaxID=566012 RepID=A0ABP6ZF47_9ACTN|nr:MDR family MFS transporter [Kineosporia mesophila]MCD5350193.1 multidrug efflux MFS transporter [Kineosporia mesophila]
MSKMVDVDEARAVGSGSVTDRRLTLISAVLALGAFVTLLDTTIVNIALDHLRLTFGASVSQAQWVSTGYLLAFVSVIPLSGWLSERFGARNAWLLAIGVFLAGSLLCGLAGSLDQLVVARVLQGIGGGMVMPVTMSIATRAAGPKRLGRATAVVALPGLLGPMLGNVLGGAIVESLSWHWLFFVNVPVGLVALVVGPRLLPAEPGHRGHRFDLPGFLLLTPGVVAVALGISQATGDEGFAANSAWGPLVAGVALLAAFTASSLRAPGTALVDVRLFARPSFGIGSVITFAGGFSTYALSFLLPLYYQQVRGESVMHTGVLLITQGLGTIFFVLVVRVPAQRLDGRVVVAGGVLLTALGAVPFALAASTPWLLAAQFAQGLGFAATTFPVMELAFSNLNHAEIPRGSAAFSVVQRVGAPFGVAVVAVILQRLLNDATAPTDAFATTFRWIVGLSAVPLVLSFFIPSGRDGEPEPVVSPPAAR